MNHTLFMGMLLGLGAAIPIGPINFEIIRRHLSQNSLAGILFGLGACIADMTYLILIVFGAIQVLKYTWLLNIITVIGSSILMWFGYMALNTKSFNNEYNKIKKSLFKHFKDGYILTFINPYNVLFWSSTSVQIISFSKISKTFGIFAGCVGVVVGVMLWVSLLNFILFKTKKIITNKHLKYLNTLGGIKYL